MFWVTPDKTLAERFAESDADKLKAKVAELERKVKELEDDNSASSSTRGER